MSKTKTISDLLAPSATPTPDEISRFQALPRDEQERLMSLAVKKGFNAPPSNRTIDEIIGDAHTSATMKKHG